MLAWLFDWLVRRRERRLLRQSDARQLIAENEPGAFYEAHRRATRLRMSGDAAGFRHWICVAAEVAKLSPVAEMDVSALKKVVDREYDRPVS